MADISTHVLDTATGVPARGVPVSLEVRREDRWELTGEGVTNDQGRLGELPTEGIEAAIYRIRFDTGAYFASRGERGFYPEVTVVFEITEPDQHHHVPLLLSPFGYSTYRGS